MFEHKWAASSLAACSAGARGAGGDSRSVAASILSHLSTALPHLHAADQHGEQQHGACGGQMLVEKQLCPGEDGCASPLASSSAVPLQHRRGTGVLLLALGGTIPMRFAHKEHGKWICHLHGFFFFFF